MKNYLTKEQAQQLREALQGHDAEAILTLALVTGMRRDELLHLKWQDIDLEKNKARVLNSKTRKEVWTLALTKEMVEILRQHQLRQQEVQQHAGAAWQNLDLVFPDSTGGFLSSDQLLAWFYEIRAQAGSPRLQFHDLRLASLRTRLEAFRAIKKEQGKE